MIGKIWSIMIILSFICAILTNKISDICVSSLEGMSKAVETIISTSGAIIFWSGIMKIAQDSGFTDKVSRLLFPILKFLFPSCSDKKNIMNPMCINIVSNMLGLSNAATPSGVKSVKEMKKENLIKENFPTFIMLNISCIQLAPTFLVSLRKSYGSKSPYDIVPFIWISSLSILIIGLLIIKAFKRKIK